MAEEQKLDADKSVVIVDEVSVDKKLKSPRKL